jgi:hypothetical protein
VALGVTPRRPMATMPPINNAKTSAMARDLALNVNDRHSMAKSGRYDLNLSAISMPAIAIVLAIFAKAFALHGRCPRVALIVTIWRRLTLICYSCLGRGAGCR